MTRGLERVRERIGDRRELARIRLIGEVLEDLANEVVLELDISPVALELLPDFTVPEQV